MKAIGILIAKENSKRFPGKNYYQLYKRPLFMHNARILKNCKYISDFYIATDSKTIKKICNENQIKVIDRGCNIIDDDQPFIEVLKFAYQSIDIRADIISSVLTNSIGHTQEAFDNAMEKIINDDEVNEVRSFDNDGNETGILIFRERVLQKQKEISSHLAMVISNAKEIHYRSDLDGIE